MAAHASAKIGDEPRRSRTPSALSVALLSAG
jgi:hypothetical protein